MREIRSKDVISRKTTTRTANPSKSLWRGTWTFWSDWLICGQKTMTLSIGAGRPTVTDPGQQVDGPQPNAKSSTETTE